MKFTEYTTIGGERWDTITDKAYGDSRKMKDIIAANPTVPIYSRLPQGITLRIPVVERPTVQSNTQKLPPWKR